MIGVFDAYDDKIIYKYNNKEKRRIQRQALTIAKEFNFKVLKQELDGDELIFTLNDYLTLDNVSYIFVHYGL